MKETDPIPKEELMKVLEFTCKGKAFDGEPKSGAFGVRSRKANTFDPFLVIRSLRAHFPKAFFGWIPPKAAATALIAIACLAIGLRSALALEPASASVISLRSEAAGKAVSVEYFYRLSTLRLTNCVAYASTNTTGAVQDLTDCTVELRVGLVVTNSTVYTGTVVVATNGTWWKEITIPDTDDTYLQVKLTHTNGTSFIYPWKVIKTKEALQ